MTRREYALSVQFDGERGEYQIRRNGGVHGELVWSRVIAPDEEWSLSKWPDVEGAYAPLVAAGLCKHRHLGSYPGLEITPAGRAALALPEKDGGRNG